jgi:hypothetical protein
VERCSRSPNCAGARCQLIDSVNVLPQSWRFTKPSTSEIYRKGTFAQTAKVRDLRTSGTKVSKGLPDYSIGPRFAIARVRPQRWGIMSLDRQVLVIAFVALTLELFLWFSELLHLDDSWQQFTTEARPDRTEGTFATSLSSRLKGDGYV